LHLAVAIPTFNRLAHLRRALASVAQQRLSPGVKLTLVVSNCASNDGTTEYLANWHQPGVGWACANEVIFTGEAANQASGATNWLRLTQTVPADVDWVWFMGDDDHLVSETAIQGLAGLLHQTQDADLALVHVCQGRRSLGSAKVLRGSLLQLCNRVGYHEMLGWMSGLVIRREIFQAFMPLAQRQYSESAYAHSAALLELCAERPALFVDMNWVDTQEGQQTEETRRRWTETDMYARHTRVVDDIASMFERGVLREKLQPVFYRYHRYSFWDRFANGLIHKLLQTGQWSEADWKDWQRIGRIADTLADPLFVKQYRAWFESLSAQSRQYIDLRNSLVQQRGQLQAAQKTLLQAPYPSSELL
jgi:hypothetical protein